MNRAILVACLSIAGLAQSYPQGSSADFNPWSHNTSAVDAKGIRRDARAFNGSPPWLLDRLGGPGPDYPIEARRMRHQGRAIVRLTLDVKTGHVVKTSLLKSSGYATLDRSAIAAFSHWTWRPGRWKEIDMPVTFEISDSSQPPPRGFMRLPRS